MNKIYLIGNGYVSNYIVKHRIDNTKFIGVCRSDKNNCDENISLDVSKDNTKISELIASTASVIYLAPPQGTGTKDTTIRNFIANVDKEQISRFIYISTSGVYGDRKDAIVNENEPVMPLTDRARRRVDAENQVAASGIDYTILRVPGIYGKGRLPLKRINERLPLIKKDLCKYTNLIHAKDLAKIIIGCLTNTKTSRLIINVSDGTPIKTTDYYLKIYDALDLSYPEFINYDQASLLYDEKRLSFIKESRILDVSLMNKIFPDIIEYKDVHDGILDSMED